MGRQRFAGRGGAAQGDRFLSREACERLLERVVRLAPGGWEISLHIRSRWSGNLRWARNEITTAGDTTEPRVTITAVHRNRRGRFQINRLDDAAIERAIERIKRLMELQAPSDEPGGMRSGEAYEDTDLWSDATYALDAARRAALQQQLVGPALAEGLLSAGFIEVAAIGNGVVNTAGLFAYLPETRAEFSVTVRNATGTGSGWAGVANKDWRQIDAARLSAIAIDKCKRSADPVAIEPGRYTVILEPQAVSDLMLPLVRSLDRIPAEMGMGPWADRPQQAAGADLVVGDVTAFELAAGTGDAGGGGNSKIGQLVLDPRITISADPGDPEAPFVPFAADGSPYRPVKWIEDGVLRELSYPRWYANRVLNKPDPLLNSRAFRMSGGDTSIEEMIARTERGLLVTRLANVRLVDYNSLLCTGTTSDGLWLIERGEITKPVKNFRFRESPLYAFNSLEALGPPVRVLQDMPAIVPPAMVHDFSMTSLADAV
jgi:predicted Zn-dependent protease